MRRRANGLTATGGRSAAAPPGPPWAGQPAVLLSWALFTLVYRVAPSARIAIGLAARAGLWAAFAWEASKYVFVWNLGRMQLQTFYGPLAFAVALVLWAYVSSVVLVFGAAVAPVAVARGR